MVSPSDRPPSRRHILTVLAAVGTGGLAGCASLTEREQPVRFCETSAPRAEDSTMDLIQEVAVNPGNPVVLSVALRQNASAFEAVDTVVVFDGTGERRFTLPAAVKSGEPPRQLYQQSLGPYPQNGRFRIEVRDTDGKTLDFVEIEYFCGGQTDTPGLS